MPSSRIPSPARSQGTKSTPRRYKPRASRSVGSPARSTSSVKLTAVMQMDSFALSPMPSRRSVLTDTTDIDIPRRRSWWKKLDENSREIMEVLNNKDPAEANNAIEEYIEVDVLSQEKKNYNLDIPESSDGESISSIVIPQRKLFTHKESKPQKKFAQIIDTRESLAPLHKSQVDGDKTINVGRKNLFNQGTKPRTKPLFPSALLNVSANKTIANKTKDHGAPTEANAQVKSLFGNRPSAKRKNMFANFIASDSEEEIAEIQPKVFGFQKTAEHKRRKSLNSRGGRESCITSPTSSITDIEMDDWRLLPSSTMVDHQLEDGLRTTPSKRARLNKLSEGTETINTTTNKTKQSNKSLHSKSKSKNISKFKETEVNELVGSDTNTEDVIIVKEKNASFTKNITNERSLKEQTFNNEVCSKSKQMNLTQTVNKVNVSKDKNLEKCPEYKNKQSSKSLSKIDQVLQSDDDDEDFTLVYENDDNVEVENEEIGQKVGKEADDQTKNSIINKTTITSNVTATKHLKNASYNNDRDSVLSSSLNKTTNRKQREGSKSVNIDTINNKSLQMPPVDAKEGNSICNQIVTCSEKDIQDRINNQDKTDGHEIEQQASIHDIRTRNKEDSCDTRPQAGQDIEDHQKSSNVESDCDEENIQDERYSSIALEEKQSTNDTEQNVSLEEVTKDEQIQEKNSEHDKNESTDEIMDDQIDEQFYNDDERNEEIAECRENETRRRSEDSKKDYAVDVIRKEEELDNFKQRNLSATKRNLEVEPNVVHNQVITNYENQIDEKSRANETQKNLAANITHNTISKNKQKQALESSKVLSPEAILHEKASPIESFTVQGRNTSVRKTKSMIKNLTIRPSLASMRQSMDLSNGSRNSSAEASGWDSHRTTRATLRQTFGKDFTPRKSLRALVMEKSAKRRTTFTEKTVEISRFPQANSTELPEFMPLDHSDVDQHVNVSNRELPRDKSNNALKMNESGNDQKTIEPKQEMLLGANESQGAKSIHEINHGVSHSIDDADNAEENNESLNPHIMDESDQEITSSAEAHKNNECEDVHETSQLDQEKSHEDSNEVQNKGESYDSQEANQSNEEEDTNQQTTSEAGSADGAEQNSALNETDKSKSKMDESDNEQEINKSDDVEEPEESDDEQVMNESDNVQETDESDDEQEINKSDDVEEPEESDGEQVMNESDIDQEIDESNDAHETNKSDDVEETEESEGEQVMNESDNVQEMDESNDAHETNKSDDEEEMVNSDDEQVMNESEDVQNMDESDDAHDRHKSDDEEEMVESDGEQVMNESEEVQAMDEIEKAQASDESNDAQDMDGMENPHDIIESDQELSSNNISVPERMSNNANSRKAGQQTTLEMYLQKVKNQIIERKKQLEDEVKSSFKAPTRDMLNPFKVPAIPKLRRGKGQQIKPKAKPVKPLNPVIPLNMLPDEMIEDMKYKPPKRYRPTNASWITKRLYKYLETKLEPKYDYKARVRSEKLVETIYNFTKDIRRHNTAPMDAVDALKHEMARLDVVKTHFEFYEFFHEYMPREVRVKVVPDVFNKIPLPKHGVFSEILR